MRFPITGCSHIEVFEVYDLEVTGQDLMDVLEECPFTQDELKNEVVAQRAFVRFGLQAGKLQQCFYLGGGQKRFGVRMKVKRLNSQMISSGQRFLSMSIEKEKGKHSIQASDAFLAVL